MSNELLFIAAIILVGFVATIMVLNKKLVELAEKNKKDETLTEWLKSMQQTVESTNKNLNQALAQTNKNIADTLYKSSQSMNERLDNAARIIGGLKKEAGAFSEISRSMRDLQEYLQSPKLRGNIGEKVLHDLIAQIIPKNSFHLQYQFKSGVMVDAAIKTDNGIIPIDAKFPMENFQKMLKSETKPERQRARRDFQNDVRKHIRDISKKYILPEEGTLDFALMYIPSEPVYYEIVNLADLTDYARSQRVYPVSPTTMYAHLQIIMLSFQGKKIETTSRQIFAMLRAIQKDYEKVEGNLGVLGKHIGNAYTQMGNVSQGFNLLGQKLSATEMIEEGDKVKQLEIE